MFLTIILGTVCLAALIPAVIFTYYAGLRVILIPIAALLAAILLGAAGAGLGWMATKLLAAGAQAITIGAVVGAAAGLALGAFAALQTAGGKTSH